MATAVYFRQKAEQCRRLANALVNDKDPAVSALRALAVEFDHKAQALPSEAAAAVLIGYGDDIRDLSASVTAGDGKDNSTN